jgi:hypothetical protein
MSSIITFTYSSKKAVKELKRQIQPKRTHTHHDFGDAHEMLVEVDDSDLSVHHREATRVQTRRNVQVRSLDNQAE